MGYSDLSLGLQNMIDFNHGYMIKALFLALFFFISIWYLAYYKTKVEKKTVLYSIMIIRSIVSAFSFFGLLFSPYIIYLFMNPTVTLDTFMTLYSAIYGPIIILIFLIVMIDFTKWGFIIMVRMVGIDSNSDEYYKFKKWYRTYIQK